MWENSNDPRVLAEAKAEIMKSTDNNPPALLDPFAGGGAIPLEAQRLGLEAHAHDLNPVAVMINKAMIEIPPKFAGQAPVNPDIRNGQMGVSGSGVWTGASGLAEDVRYYGEWMKKKAFEKIGHLYPKVIVPKERGGGEATPIAWFWARAVRCPNPACHHIVPLVSTWVLSKKKGQEAYIDFRYESDDSLIFDVKHGNYPEVKEFGTKFVTDKGKAKRGAFCCPVCSTIIDASSYIEDEANNGRMLSLPMAVAVEAERGREYLSCNKTVMSQLLRDVENYYSVNDIEQQVPHEKCRGTFASNAQGVYYGFHEFKDYFTKRQLIALTTLSNLVEAAQEQAERDAVQAGMFNDHIGIANGGSNAKAYGEAIGVYLAFAIDRVADYNSSVCSWLLLREGIRNTFGRQAIPMVWDYTEANPFSNSSGCWSNMMEWIFKSIQQFPGKSINGKAKQHDAQTDNRLRNILISTDPPYYDNIDYSDLSDFFYVWMRKSLRTTYPDVFRTMLVPKAEELIATPYRHDGDANKAKEFFEDGMFNTCCQLYKYASEDAPITIYYAYKQSDTDAGWVTMLSAIIRAGFAITGTWPMRTEMANRAVAAGANALASSIVLVCRKRDENARSVTRREFINALHREMRPALEKLQSANIAPVDLAQSAIGPGIGVFSRYKSVLEADGKPMNVRAALQIINQELDAFYNEQEGEMDSGSRFCVDLFQQFGFNEMAFGEAQVLATAKNTSLQTLADRHVLQAVKGRVHLLTREEIPDAINSSEECIWLLTQQLAHRFEKEGVKGCAKELAGMFGSNAENAKALAYRLYTICERKGWAQEGYAYNNLVVAWPEILSMAASIKAETPVQMTLDDVIKEMSPAE